MRTHLHHVFVSLGFLFVTAACGTPNSPTTSETTQVSSTQRNWIGDFKYFVTRNSNIQRTETTVFLGAARPNTDPDNPEACFYSFRAPGRVREITEANLASTSALGGRRGAFYVSARFLDTQISTITNEFRATANRLRNEAAPHCAAADSHTHLREYQKEVCVPTTCQLSIGDPPICVTYNQSCHWEYDRRKDPSATKCDDLNSRAEAAIESAEAFERARTQVLNELFATVRQQSPLGLTPARISESENMQALIDVVELVQEKAPLNATACPHLSGTR